MTSRATAAPLAVAGSSGAVTNTTPVPPTTQVFRSSFKGLQAYAAFESQSPPSEGCVTTIASISAEQGASMVSLGETVHQPTVQLSVDTWEGCFLSVLVSSASGTALLAPGAFQIDKTLASAQVDATVQVTDDKSANFPVGIHVVWVGTGALSSLKTHTHLTFPDATMIVDGFDGITRAASATGSVTQDTHSPFEDLAGAAIFAGLGDFSYSDLTIVR